jgi:hypothetical protein
MEIILHSFFSGELRLSDCQIKMKNRLLTRMKSNRIPIKKYAPTQKLNKTHSSHSALATVSSCKAPFSPEQIKKEIDVYFF